MTLEGSREKDLKNKIKWKNIWKGTEGEYSLIHSCSVKGVNIILRNYGLRLWKVDFRVFLWEHSRSSQPPPTFLKGGLWESVRCPLWQTVEIIASPTDLKKKVQINIIYLKDYSLSIRKASSVAGSARTMSGSLSMCSPSSVSGSIFSSSKGNWESASKLTSPVRV